MSLEDRLDLKRLANLSHAALWVHVHALDYAIDRRTRGYVPDYAARELSEKSMATGGALPVRELVRAGLWERSKDGFQIRQAFCGPRRTRTETEIATERERVISEVKGMPKQEGDRELIYRMAKFMAGEEP